MRARLLPGLACRAFQAAADGAASRAAPALLTSCQHMAVASSSAIAQQQRSFWASSATAMSAPLADVLKAELKHEKEHYVKPTEIANGPPAPYTLAEAPGDTMLTLTRSFTGGETITVDLHVNNQPAADYEEEDGSGEVVNSVVFNVSINKKDTTLVFECESDGTYVSINHVSYEPKNGVQSESMYTGPVFDELDETLQGEFRALLEARGITPELGEYLRHLVYDKEQREYMRWLEQVNEFVKP